MRDYRNMLLAGVAALALAAGTGLASAQGPNGGEQRGPQHATQPMQGNGGGMHAQGQQEPNRTAQDRTPQGANQGQQGAGTGAGAQAQGQQGPNRTAQGANQGRQGAGTGAGAQAQGQGKANPTAQNRAPSGAQQEGMGRNSRQAQGAPAQASSANVRLSERQRTEIQHTVVDARGAPRVGHVDFDVRVGTVIPRGRIHIIPVPETLVRIEPRWRGLLYFVYSEEVVIVDPHDMRIVAVLPV
jgi:hypothetical protein